MATGGDDTMRRTVGTAMPASATRTTAATAGHHRRLAAGVLNMSSSTGSENEEKSIGGAIERAGAGVGL